LKSHRRRGLATAFAIAVIATTQTVATAQIEQGDLTFDLKTVASGLPAPVLVTHAGDGSGRIFIVDQRGKILILQDGQILPTPFLEVLPPELVTVNNGYDERGLLGLAFHPDFAKNGRVFVRYGKPRTGGPGEPCTNTSRGCHEEVLAEYRVMSNDPNRVDPASARYLLRIAKPQFNHNGGAIAFGPDGYLYMSMGDGGGANDGLADNPPSHGAAETARTSTR
jgi:glucose/arabinose dehydrogenase